VLVEEKVFRPDVFNGRIERSASRLLGKGLSSVVSVAIGSFNTFAFSSLYSTPLWPKQPPMPFAAFPSIFV
jgi:hypothetical protein